MDRKNTRDTQELYAAWGTTREEHMSRMLQFIDCQNARVAADETSMRSRIDAYPLLKKTDDGRFIVLRHGKGRPVCVVKTMGAKYRRRW